MKLATATLFPAEGPRRPRRLTPMGPGRDAVAAASPPAVLLADPDPASRARLAEVLANDDLAVLEADDEAGVKQAAATERLDFAVVDAKLPGASRLRRHLAPHVPIVLVTAEPGPFADAVAMALDAVGVLDKPIDEDDLRTIVWNLAVPR